MKMTLIGVAVGGIAATVFGAFQATSMGLGAFAACVVVGLGVDGVLYLVDRSEWGEARRVLRRREMAIGRAEARRLAFAGEGVDGELRQTTPGELRDWEVRLRGVFLDSVLNTSAKRALALEAVRRGPGVPPGAELEEGGLVVRGGTSQAGVLGAALDVLAALRRHPWEGAVEGLSLRDGELHGVLEGRVVRVWVEVDPVRTLIRVAVETSLRAAVGLEGRASGNVVVDQLIGVNGPDPRLDDDAFVGALLEVVHGLGGRVDEHGVGVVIEGISVEKLPAAVQSCVGLAAMLRG